MQTYFYNILFNSMACKMSTQKCMARKMSIQKCMGKIAVQLKSHWESEISRN